MVTSDRWMAAQQYERGYWEGVASRIAQGSASQMDWYRWRADQLVARLQALGLGRVTGPSSKIVEVGCGPIGVASFFPAGERIAVDPLEPFYGSNPVLSKLRDPSVMYRQGLGEDLPCESNAFDLLIIENCIDHVQDVKGVMREINRVLKPDGVLYLTVNCRTKLGYVVHRALSRSRIDRGHPHTFTPPKLERMLAREGWRVQGREIGSYMAALKEDLAGPALRSRIKAVLGTSEFISSVIATRI
jgi:SAM-dependent methyltransferase